MAENNWVLNDVLPVTLSQQFSPPLLESTFVYWGPAFLAYMEAQGAGSERTMDSTVALPFASTGAIGNRVTLSSVQALPLGHSAHFASGRIESTVALPFNQAQSHLITENEHRLITQSGHQLVTEQFMAASGLATLNVVVGLSSSARLPFAVSGVFSSPPMESSVRLPFGVTGTFAVRVLADNTVQLPFNLGRAFLITETGDRLITEAFDHLLTEQHYSLSNAEITVEEMAERMLDSLIRLPLAVSGEIDVQTTLASTVHLPFAVSGDFFHDRTLDSNVRLPFNVLGRLGPDAPAVSTPPSVTSPMAWRRRVVQSRQTANPQQTEQLPVRRR